MGQTYLYMCNGCGYQAKVSGKLDYGMLAVVQTMTCENCEELVDVLVGARGKVGKTGDPEWDKTLNRCPMCKGKKVSPLPESNPCPKCKEEMTRGELVCDWD